MPASCAAIEQIKPKGTSQFAARLPKKLVSWVNMTVAIFFPAVHLFFL
jgi:hypothetical protein